MHRKGRPANRLPLSCAFFSLMRYLEHDSTVNSNTKWMENTLQEQFFALHKNILMYIRARN